MLNIKGVFGGSDNGFTLDGSKLTGDVAEDSRSEYVGQFVGGRLASIGSDGFIKLTEGDKDYAEGFIINDASGYFMENTPALASGIVTVLCGGGVVLTDQVVEEDIAAGDKLYAGKEGNAGLVTKTETGSAIGVARTGNSASDKTIELRFF